MTDVSGLSASESTAKELNLQVNVADAIAHLRLIDRRPEARFDLASIDPTGRAPLQAKTFLGNELNGRAFAAWLLRENKSCGVYFTLNEARAGTPRDKRLANSDVGLVRAHPADIDILLGGDRTKGEVQGDLITCDAPPSLIVDSGNGLWPTWVLEGPVTVESVDATAQNKALVARFGADSCADVCRLVRLAGTVNWPNAGKAARGCVPVVAAMLSYKGPRYASAEMASAYQPGKTAPPAQDMTPLAHANAGVVELCLDYLTREALVAVNGSGGRKITIDALNHCMDEGADPDLAAVLVLHHLKTVGEDWSLPALKKLARELLASRKTPIGSASPEVEFANEAGAYDPLRPAGLPPLYALTAVAVSEIKARKWLVGKFLARGYLAALGAPGGAGKTQLLAQIAVAAASGRADILGPDFPLHERVRVFFWNQEDEREEILRRCGGVMQAHGISDVDMAFDGKPGVVFGSGVEQPLIISKPGTDGLMVDTKEAERLAEYLKNENFGLAMFDPFAEMHSASEESDNVQIIRVAAAFRRIAVRASIGALLAVHTRKPSNASSEAHAGNMDSFRGASALAFTCRMAATLFELDAKTAKEWGVPEEDRGRYLRFDDAKANMSMKRSDPLFFKRESVRLPTVEGKMEDVGVLMPLHLARPEKNSKSADTLVEDVIALLAAEGMWIGELAAQMVQMPLYADQAEATVKQRIRRAFAPPKEGEDAKNTKGVRYEMRSKTGVQGKQAWLELQDYTALQKRL